MSAGDEFKRVRFVTTEAACAAVKGHERDVLDGLGIRWRAGRPHINCPYPDHEDHDPSWRWDERRAYAVCTCLSNSHADSIFDVVGKIEMLDFEAAKIRTAELLGRTDIIKSRRPKGAAGGAGTNQKTDAISLLNPPAANRNDNLVYTYLGARLAVGPDSVTRLATPIAGLRSLAYFAAKKKGSKASVYVAIGSYPCAVFGTAAADGRKHAHRIYLDADGTGKAELGVGPNGLPFNSKKSARVAQGQPSTAGCCAIWGDVERASHCLLCEGIETAAIALAFAVEIVAGDVMVMSAITAGGVEAFAPWPVTQRVTVAADRDEAKKGHGYKRGERAARVFGVKNHEKIKIIIALPGDAGESADWLNILARGGIEAVRAGILTADPYAPTAAESRGGATGDWYSKCLTGSDGRTLCNLSNTLLALREDRACRALFTRNDMFGSAILTRRTPQ